MEDEAAPAPPLPLVDGSSIPSRPPLDGSSIPSRPPGDGSSIPSRPLDAAVTLTKKEEPIDYARIQRIVDDRIHESLLIDERRRAMNKSLEKRERCVYGTCTGAPPTCVLAIASPMILGERVCAEAAFGIEVSGGRVVLRAFEEWKPKGSFVGIGFRHACSCFRADRIFSFVGVCGPLLPKESMSKTALVGTSNGVRTADIMLCHKCGRISISACDADTRIEHMFETTFSFDITVIADFDEPASAASAASFARPIYYVAPNSDLMLRDALR